MTEEPILQIMPEDPGATVMWAGFRDARCGDDIGADMGKGCCHKLFRFRACVIDGIKVYATVCNTCDLKYQIFTATLPGQCRMYAQELAREARCTVEEAIDMSWKAFGYIAPHKVKWGQAKKSDKSKKKSRNPYAD
jgi:hypothetical protein